MNNITVLSSDDITDQGLCPYFNSLFAFGFSFDRDWCVIITNLSVDITTEQFKLILSKYYSHHSFNSYISWTVGKHCDECVIGNTFTDVFKRCGSCIVGSLLDVIEFIEKDIIDDDFSE